MKIMVSSRMLFVTGFALVILTNIIVLYGVYANRSGSPEALISLSERELPLPYGGSDENSGLALNLSWKTLPRNSDDNYAYRNSPTWFNEEKLRELGFEIDEDRDVRWIYKEVFIVLENNGESYREAVRRVEAELARTKELWSLKTGDKQLSQKLESAQEAVQRMRVFESRLFAEDAGLDPEKLREKYSDRGRYIITKGLVRPSYHYYNKDDKSKNEIYGYISGLSVTQIHVSLKYRQNFDGLPSRWNSIGTIIPPRYEVQLAYGSRHEPWIESVTPLVNAF